jgi:mono/diheme cytochrome c family protein
MKVGERDMALRQAALVASTAIVSLAGAAAIAASNDAQPSFTQAQVDAGQAVYAKECARCHGANLQGAVGPALAGPTFATGWHGKSLQDYYDVTAVTMPQTAVTS